MFVHAKKNWKLLNPKQSRLGFFAPFGKKSLWPFCQPIIVSALLVPWFEWVLLEGCAQTVAALSLPSRPLTPVAAAWKTNPELTRFRRAGHDDGAALGFIMLPVKRLLGKEDKSGATLRCVGECSPSGGFGSWCVTGFCCNAVAWIQTGWCATIWTSSDGLPRTKRRTL